MLLSEILLWKQVTIIKTWGTYRYSVGISLALMFLFSGTIPLNAQTKIDYDYQVFKESFQKEIKAFEHNPKEQSKPRKVFYVQLPGWFFHHQQNQNQIQSIGISDPGMDSSKAMKQAVMRAYGVAILYRGSRIHCMTHSFSEYYPSTKENFLRFISLNSLDVDTSFDSDCVRILNKRMLPSKEMIVEIAFGRDTSVQKSGLHFRLHLDFFTQDERKNTTESLQSKIAWKIMDINGSDTLSDVFNLYGFQPAYLWISNFDKYFLTSDSLKFNFYYWSDDSVSNKNQAEQNYSLKQGLWPAYLNAIVNNLVFSAYNKQCKTNIQSLSDFYTLKTVSFSQIMNSDTTSGLIPDLYFKDNQLSVKPVCL